MIHNSIRGQVYELSNGTILKRTNDKIEYDNAISFLKKPSPYFVNIISANPIDDSTPQEYEIIMEKLKPLNNSQWERVDLIMNSLGRQDYMLDDSRRMSFLGELKRNPEWYENFSSYKEIVDTVYQLKRMYKEAQNRGIVLFDLRAQNLGVNSKGDMVHFDMGAG